MRMNLSFQPLPMRRRPSLPTAPRKYLLCKVPLDAAISDSTMIFYYLNRKLSLLPQPEERESSPNMRSSVSCNSSLFKRPLHKNCVTGLYYFRRQEALNATPQLYDEKWLIAELGGKKIVSSFFKKEAKLAFIRLL